MKLESICNKPTIVTAAIIRKGDSILIAKRNKDSWLEPNKWEFPGGKVKQSEKFEDCLIREIKEELDIDISISKFFIKYTHIYFKDNKEIPIILMVYFADWMNGVVSNIDCQDSKWVKYNELKNFEFAAADKPVVKKLLMYLKKEL